MNGDFSRVGTVACCDTVACRDGTFETGGACVGAAAVVCPTAATVRGTSLEHPSSSNKDLPPRAAIRDET